MSAEKPRIFTKHTGSESSARLRRRGKAGEGYAGRLHFVRARLQRGEKTHDMRLVFKKLGKNTDFGDDEKRTLREGVEKVLRNYETLKKLTLPVLPTFRADFDRGGILMTDLTQGGTHVSLTSTTHAYIEERFITKINNFREVVERVAQCARISAAYRIRIAGDEYNIVVPKGGRGNAELFLTDLECMVTTNKETEQYLEERNLEDASEVLWEIVQRYVAKTRHKEYKQIIADILGDDLHFSDEEL